MQLIDLAQSCALHVRDEGFNELSKSNWTRFIGDAGIDARDSGWFLPMSDDTSITVTAQTYNYAVPAGFAYVDAILLGETINDTDIFLREVPANHWDIRLRDGVPNFELNTVTEMITGKPLKVIGQKRPGIYTTQADTLDSGMESFLRERALYFGFRFLGAGVSELSRWRQIMAQQAWATSEAFLKRHPQEFRMRPNAREVLGRR